MSQRCGVVLTSPILTLSHPLHVTLKMAASNSGGFIPYSPPPSSLASSNASQALPYPRSTPLKAGGTKESSFIRHVDQQILHIQRRFAKRTAPNDGFVQETDEEGRMIEEIGDPTTKSQLEKSEAVSYTHLTLPTKRIV